MSTFLSTVISHFDFIDPPRAESLLHRYHASYAPSSLDSIDPYTSDEGPLAPDELGLLFACLCLGRFSELFKMGVVLALVDQGQRDDVGYFRHALGALDGWSEASCTALRK